MLKPINDKIKVLVDKDEYNYGGNSSGKEGGTVVEVPSKEEFLYFAFHSFAWEVSLANSEVLDKIYSLYEKLVGKYIIWESLQDRGRRFQEDDSEYVFLNMTDVLAYEPKGKSKAYSVEDTRSGGFKI
jgi:co-chaperonin GroES (HSP10)